MNSSILPKVLAIILALTSIFILCFLTRNKNITEPTNDYTNTTEAVIDPSDSPVKDIISTTIPPNTMPIQPAIKDIIEIIKPFPSPSTDEIVWYGEYRTHTTNKITTHVAGELVNVEFLAKLLFAEAAISSWIAQVYTCSAILNFCDYENISLWEAGHDIGCFAVAPHVDEMEPTEETYKVVDYVLNGGRIAEICYFRTKRFHGFGTPVCQIENHYFSKP